MEVTVKINTQNKQAKALLEMLKTFDFVKFVDRDEIDNISKEEFIEELSKKINKGVATKWYEKSGIEYKN